MALEHSRVLRLAGEVASQPERTLLDRLEAARLLVTFDADPDLVATARLIVETARRLPVGIAIDVPAEPEAGKTIVRAAAEIDPDRLVARERIKGADFHVHIGAGCIEADLLARPERHGARLSSEAKKLIARDAGSGLGVMTCASLVGAEIFKRLAQVLPERGPRHHELTWCPVTLGADPLLAPPLTERATLDFALVGLGAIGTAVARILSMLPFSGRALLVDPERFAKENVGTYSLGVASDAEQQNWKTEIVARTLQHLDCVSFNGPVEELIEAIDRREIAWPPLVLTGLDSAHARRNAQRLWPDRLIDGATGDTMCGMHDTSAEEGSPCLMCLFPSRIEGPSATERLAAATGLRPELLRYGDQPLRAEHIRELPSQQRALLEPHVGKPVCGLAQAVGLTTLASDGYMPSVPFVSQQAACLVVGRLLASLLRVEKLPNFVQYDALIGPMAATILDRRTSEDCYCQQRADLVSRVREVRRKQHQKPAGD